jgi:HK97 family phage major capsid protein
MNNTTRARVMGLKDTLGRPLFIPNPNSGVLDHILGRPITLAQALPTAFTSGNTGVLYGDFNAGYLLRTDGPMSIRRSDDRFIDSLETIFVAYSRIGGHATDAGTHPILKLATL